MARYWNILHQVLLDEYSKRQFDPSLLRIHPTIRDLLGIELLPAGSTGGVIAIVNPQTGSKIDVFPDARVTPNTAYLIGPSVPGQEHDIVPVDLSA